MPDTIREQIMDYLVTHFDGMTEGQPVSDPYTVAFSQVSREDVEKVVKGKKAVLGIYDIEETKQVFNEPFTDCNLKVVLEIHVRKPSSGGLSQELNKYLGDVERRLLEDQTFGGLIRDVGVSRTALDVDGVYDSELVAILEAVIVYRHKTGDPRTKT